MQERYESLNRAGAPYGIRFGHRTFLSNSRPALEASEYARDLGAYETFHERIFRAYFTELHDIGDVIVLLDLGSELGLNPVELKRALEQGRYAARIERAIQDAGRLGINAVPTFIINETHKVVGAQDLSAFKRLLQRIQQE
jgi:predicted DsbA family dithiol-disulfide isomerase